MPICPEKLFFQKMFFFQNGSGTCSRGRYRYYDQFAVSIALRSFSWIWFIMKRVAGRPLYQPDQPGLWWSLHWPVRGWSKIPMWVPTQAMQTMNLPYWKEQVHRSEAMPYRGIQGKYAKGLNVKYIIFFLKFKYLSE